MAKRAVIYVRTSSEYQGAKCSPVEQEIDCRKFAETQGPVVVNVYRDIERYRVKNKWVEPSGTRYDRPGLLAMLRDAADNQFDVILAWREDRLYRGMRAMLLVLETIQQNNISIMLALETFDPATAPLKAWLAQVELEHIINIDALNDWEAKFSEYLADLQAGIDELKKAAPQTEEERHDVFLLKKQMVDTLLERATINKNREVKVEIRVNLLEILEQDAGLGDPNRGGIFQAGRNLYPYTRFIPRRADPSGDLRSFRTFLG